MGALGSNGNEILKLVTVTFDILFNHKLNVI